MDVATLFREEELSLTAAENLMRSYKDLAQLADFVELEELVEVGLMKGSAKKLLQRLKPGGDVHAKLMLAGKVKPEPGCWRALSRIVVQEYADLNSMDIRCLEPNEICKQAGQPILFEDPSRHRSILRLPILPRGWVTVGERRDNRRIRSCFEAPTSGFEILFHSAETQTIPQKRHRSASSSIQRRRNPVSNIRLRSRQREQDVERPKDLKTMKARLVQKWGRVSGRNSSRRKCEGSG